MADWIRVDVDILRDPELLAAGRDAFLLFIHGLTYAGEQETDGFVPDGVAKACPWIKSPPAIRALTMVRNEDDGPLWTPVAGGFQIRRYTTKNPTHSELEAERAKARDRMQRIRNARRERPPDVRPNSRRSSTTTVQVQEREDLDLALDLNGQVGLEGGSGGKPAGFAADQDQDPIDSDQDEFADVLGGRLAFVFAKIRRSGGPAWRTIIPAVFEDQIAKHGKPAVDEALEALALMHPDDLRVVDRPRAYVIAAIEGHAGNRSEVVPK